MLLAGLSSLVQIIKSCTLLKSLIVPEKDADGILFAQNKLVIVEEIVDPSQPEAPKRKKKETKEEVSEQPAEVAPEEDNSTIEDNHTTDDSILPESSS